MRRTPRRRSHANSRRPLPERRARRLARAEEPDPRAGSAACSEDEDAAGEPMGLENPDPVEGPVGGDGAADDPPGGDWSPESAVVGFPTVVPHHEPVSGRNLHRGREVALGTRAALADVGVRLTLA